MANRLAEAGTCKICRHWAAPVSSEDEFMGLCRRHAPDFDGWPATREMDSCGDFREASFVEQQERLRFRPLRDDQ